MRVARWIITALGMASALGALAAPAAGAHAAFQTCSTETYQWSGQVALDPGASFATGVNVPAQQGTDIVVSGTSADALDAQGFASSLAVTIGGVPASAGAEVPGGEIVLMYPSGTAVLTAYGAAVTVNRCTTVEQAGPVPVTGSGGGGGSSSTLPASGSTSLPLVAASAGVTLVGIACVAAVRPNRRRGAAQLDVR